MKLLKVFTNTIISATTTICLLIIGINFIFTTNLGTKFVLYSAISINSYFSTKYKVTVNKTYGSLSKNLQLKDLNLIIKKQSMFHVEHWLSTR